MLAKCSKQGQQNKKNLPSEQNDCEDEGDFSDDEEDEFQDAVYPTLQAIHSEIQKQEFLPSWSQSTTYKVLMGLGFEWLSDHRIHLGLIESNLCIQFP